MVPVWMACWEAQFPVVLTVNGNEPSSVGVPLILKSPLLNVPIRPDGNPETVAPVPASEISKSMDSIAVLIQTV